MKTGLFALTLILATSLEAATIKLKPIDSEKLSILVSKLSLSVRSKKTTKLPPSDCGIRIANTFESGPLKLNCSSDYYNKSIYQTTGRCSVTVDMKHADVSQKNNEIRVLIKDDADALALFNAIPYGKPEKGFWGWERDYGVNYDGYKAPLFHYYIKCSKIQCAFTFSAYNLAQ